MVMPQPGQSVAAPSTRLVRVLSRRWRHAASSHNYGRAQRAIAFAPELRAHSAGVGDAVDRAQLSVVVKVPVFGEEGEGRLLRRSTFSGVASRPSRLHTWLWLPRPVSPCASL